MGSDKMGKMCGLSLPVRHLLQWPLTEMHTVLNGVKALSHLYPNTRWVMTTHLKDMVQKVRDQEFTLKSSSPLSPAATDP